MFLRLALACLLCAPAAQAATIVAQYGDDDGFGVGVTSVVLTPVQIAAMNATADDAAFTDAPMFTDSLNQPQFRPTGSFTPFSVTGEILSATLTLRVAGLRVGTVNNNRIFLDGNDILSGNLFDLIPDRSAPHTGIDEVSVSLVPFFFPFLADGAVSLDGSRILQLSDTPLASNGPFQVDFIRLTIETRDPDVTPVPLPAAAPLLLVGLGAVAVAGRRGRRAGLRRGPGPPPPHPSPTEGGGRRVWRRASARCRRVSGAGVVGSCHANWGDRPCHA
ncbi:MAG: hypothetical protein MUF73_07570 [Rhodobacteraceae bacterium]|jgi:hypothetical protein|nr:hypothetical protein [Paracoccaceae bacterium]